MIQRGQGKEGGRVLFGAGNVEVMGRLRESSSNDMIETETKLRMSLLLKQNSFLKTEVVGFLQSKAF